MSNRLYDIAVAIAPAITQRTLENLRRSLEDLYVRSTAQGSSQEDQDAFNAELIAKAHLVAQRDNATMIYQWAREIEATIDRNSELDTRIDFLRQELATVADQIRHYQSTLQGIADGSYFPTYSTEELIREKASTTRALQKAQDRIPGLQEELRNLQQSHPAPAPGRAPYAGPTRPLAPGSIFLDGRLSPLSPKDP